MDRERWSAIDHYFTGALHADDPALTAALSDSEAAGLPSINVSPAFGKLLNLLVRMHNSKTVLELGTLGGYSTIWLARALPPGGRVITIELDPKHAAVARANLERAGLSDVVEIRLGRGVDVLAEIAAEGLGPFDFVFIDADKPSNADYMTWALKLTRPGSVVIVDNVTRGGAVVESTSTDANVKGVRRLIDLLADEPRFDATAIHTAGVKGHDGFIIGLVTDGN